LVDFITLGNTGVENSNPKSQFLPALQDPLLFGACYLAFIKNLMLALAGALLLFISEGKVWLKECETPA